MVVWLIETFWGSELERAFYAIALMTAPVWLGMIFLPGLTLVRRIAHPFILPPFYCLILGLVFWNAFESALLPGRPVGFDFEAARSLSQHPIIFLLLFCNWQILNLVLGTVMYQKSLSSSCKAPLELLLCWILGAWALIPFALRLILRRKRQS
ncbi:MAG: abscisic acid-deficient protein Aba4 family protein [Coraliomargaritaceae bacterium]